jgi:hypothetical protein
MWLFEDFRTERSTRKLIPLSSVGGDKAKTDSEPWRAPENLTFRLAHANSFN